MIIELKKELSKLSGVDFFNPKYRDVFKKYFPNDESTDAENTNEEERLKEVIGEDSYEELTEETSNETENFDETTANADDNSNDIEENEDISNVEQDQVEENESVPDTERRRPYVIFPKIFPVSQNIKIHPQKPDRRTVPFCSSVVPGFSGYYETERRQPGRGIL